VSTAALHGLLAEFDSAAQLLAAVRALRAAAGHLVLEAYAPFPVEGLTAALGERTDRVPLAMLLGALGGGLGTFALECYAAVFDYPLNIGGRPPFSWPAFIPPALEMTLLGAAVLGVLAMLAASGLPRLRHPLFAVAAFERASSDRFFLLVRAAARGFDEAAVRALLEELPALAVIAVPA